MLAYYVHHLNPYIIQFGHGFALHWYGFAYVLGFVCGYQLLLWMSRHGYSEIPPQNVEAFVTGAAFFGVLVGGRLGYALFYDFENTVHNPLRIFEVWQGGMASHGGILGLIIYTFWYSKRHKVSWTGLGDNLVVVAPIGLFFGRCANFINGELFGRPTTVPWAMQFPKELLDDPNLEELAKRACEKIDPTLDSAGAIVDASRHSEAVRHALSHILTPRHPSQLYEAGLEGIFLFVCLWLLRTRTRVPKGVVTGAFFLIYAAVRIFGEEFREPDVGVAFTLGFTRGQFLSLFMILIGAAFVVTGFIFNRPSLHPAEKEKSAVNA